MSVLDHEAMKSIRRANRQRDLDMRRDDNSNRTGTKAFADAHDKAMAGPKHRLAGGQHWLEQSLLENGELGIGR